MDAKTVYLCAKCARDFSQAMKLQEAPQQSAKKDTCLFCGRICYGTQYFSAEENSKSRKGELNA